MKIMHRWKVISSFRLVQEKNSFVFTRLVIRKTVARWKVLSEILC